VATANPRRQRALPIELYPYFLIGNVWGLNCHFYDRFYDRFYQNYSFCTFCPYTPRQPFRSGLGLRDINLAPTIRIRYFANLPTLKRRGDAIFGHLDYDSSYRPTLFWVRIRLTCEWILRDEAENGAFLVERMDDRKLSIVQHSRYYYCYLRRERLVYGLRLPNQRQMPSMWRMIPLFHVQGSELHAAKQISSYLLNTASPPALRNSAKYC
jgi:hypothetical protein